MNINTTANVNSNTLRRGVKKPEAVAMVKKFSFSTAPFTIKEAVYAIGIDHWYVVNHIKTNAVIVGEAPKTKGARGPAAKLYQFGATASVKTVKASPATETSQTVPLPPVAKQTKQQRVDSFRVPKSPVAPSSSHEARLEDGQYIISKDGTQIAKFSESSK